jgi:thioredoxin-related protein
MSFWSFLCSILLAFSVAAKPPSDLPQIQWFSGDITDAFALAKKQKKPLFLYWGARWCPPCNQIKKTIFTKKQFQAEMKHFIPVYLDGDTKRAQVWGEKLKSSGYPTMIIYSPDGTEVNRITTGIDIVQYVRVLQESRSNLIPIETLLKRGLDNKATDQEWSILSNYSWAQNKTLSETHLSKKNKSNTFKRLFENTPSRLKIEKNRLFLHYLSALDAEKERLSPKEMKNLILILNDSSMAKGNLELLTYSSGKFFKLFKKDNNQIDPILWSTYRSSMNQLKLDKTLSSDEQLSLWVPEIYYFETQNKPFSEEFKESVYKITKEISSKSKDFFDRQASMYTAVWLLKKTNQMERAKKQALEEIQKSETPFYFMSYLANIEKDMGNNSEYIKWKEKAWKSSTGHATRFQWGSSYVIALLSERPQDQQRISTALDQVIKEVFSQNDALFGRNKGRMSKMQEQIIDWKKTYKNAYPKVLTTLKASCKQAKAKKDCQDWLGTL